MPKQITAKNRRERRALAARMGSRESKRSPVPVTPVDRQKTEVILAARERLKSADSARRVGNLDRAQSICEKLIDDFPDYVGALHMLGIIQMAKDSYWLALSCFVRAAMLSPLDWTILASLGQVYIGLDAIEQAAHTLNQALAIKEDEAEIHFSLGQVYNDQREYELAAQTLNRAGSLDPSHDAAFLLLGMVLTHLGDLDGAAEAFVTAHRNGPARAGPLAGLAQLPARFVKFDVLASLDKISGNWTSENWKKQERAAFARANLLDQAGQFDAAWNWLETANKPIAERLKEQLSAYVEERPSKLASATSNSFKPNRPSKDHDVPVSLFILGVSRSGKTTLERLVSALPGVKRGYENMIVEHSAQRASQISGLLSLRNLRVLPQELEGEFTDFYLEDLRQRAQGSAVFTNTHPGRISDVGRLANCIHNVRFVFVKRNRNDTALRILMKHYREGTNPYAYDIQSAFDEIDFHHRLAEEWQLRLPDICLTVKYEDIADDPASHVAQIAALCGIDAEITDLPPVGDDRDCAEPYTQHFNAK